MHHRQLGLRNTFKLTIWSKLFNGMCLHIQMNSLQEDRIGWKRNLANGLPALEEQALGATIDPFNPIMIHKMLFISWGGANPASEWWFLMPDIQLRIWVCVNRTGSGRCSVRMHWHALLDTNFKIMGWKGGGTYMGSRVEEISPKMISAERLGGGAQHVTARNGMYLFCAFGWRPRSQIGMCQMVRLSNNTNFILSPALTI